MSSQGVLTTMLVPVYTECQVYIGIFNLLPHTLNRKPKEGIANSPAWFFPSSSEVAICNGNDN